MKQVLLASVGACVTISLGAAAHAQSAAQTSSGASAASSQTSVTQSSPRSSSDGSIAEAKDASAAAAPLQAAPAAASSLEPSPGASVDTVSEIVVTAQKRAQSINNVGESISAVSGDQLLQQGIVETSQLTKIIPGFSFTETPEATPVYTIRGVGFQESTLAASPAVSVYVDEVPLPFPIETEAAGLDLERVEVLKGPQGTLFGQNSTGGAINYIAAKPTDTFQAGVDASFARFDTTDVSAFVSGPVTDTLKARLSFRGIESGDYQKSYTSNAELGAQNRLEGRLLLDWRPIQHLKVAVNLNVSSDRSDTPAAQFFGIDPANAAVPLTPGFANYPVSPRNDRAAGFDAGLNYRRNNIFYQASSREDYDFGHDVVLTSISAYERFTRNQLVDGDGTPYQDALSPLTGSVTTLSQELRLAGRFGPKGTWLIGGNYEHDQVPENGASLIADSTTGNVPGLGFQTEQNTTKQAIRTAAVFGNFEYEILPKLTLQGGARFTQADRSFQGCGADYGDGQFASVFDTFQFVLKGPTGVIPIAKGGCGTLSTPAFTPGLPAYTPELVRSQLNQNNVSWRTGLNYQLDRNVLLYANVSRGYKSGSFPFLGAAFDIQFTPVTQESLLAYEGGFKATLFDRKLQLNAAGYYYDYTNKQIRGYFDVPVFGALESLLNIPKSHVAGFELSAEWHPIDGLTISPAVTLVDSRIDGNYTNFNPQLQQVLLTGEQFPDAPKWQGFINAEYRHGLTDALDGFAGMNVSYQGATNGALGAEPRYDINSYALLDLRAGLETKSGTYRLTVFGRNVTDQFYLVESDRRVDVDRRYAGLPATYGVELAYRFR